MQTDRRTFIKGIGAGAGAAAIGYGGTGTVAAEEYDDWDADVTPDTLDDYEWDVGGQTRNATDTIYKMLSGADFDDLAAVSAGTKNPALGTAWVAQKAFGVFGDDDSSADQLKLDTYGHMMDVYEMLKWMFEMIVDNVQMAETNAMAIGQYEAYKGIEDDRSSFAVGEEAHQAVLDMGARYEKNVIRIIDGMMMRVVNASDRQLSHPDIGGQELGLWYQDGSDYDLDIIDTSAFELDLINGEKAQAHAVICSTGETESAQTVVHPYFAYSDRVNDDDLDRFHMNDNEELDGTTASRLTYNYNSNGSTFYGFYVEYDGDSDNVFPEPSTFDNWGHDDMFNSEFITNYIDEVIIDRFETLASEARTAAEDAVEAYDRGEIDAEDLLNPYVQMQELGQDWEETGHFGFAQTQAAQLGYSTDIGTTAVVDVVFGADELDGELDEDTEPDTELSGGFSHSGYSDEFEQVAENYQLEDTIELTENPLEYVSDIEGRTTVEYDDAENGWTTVADSNIGIGVETGEIIVDSGSDVSDGDTVRVTIEYPSAFKKGEWYTVEGDQTAMVALDNGDGIETLTDGDAFRLAEIYDRDGNELDEFRTREYNHADLDTDNLEEVFARWKTLQQEQDAERREVTVLGGGGGGGGSDDGFGARTLVLGGLAGLAGLVGVGEVARRAGD